MNKTHTIFANIALLFVYGLVILFGYWTFFPYNPLVIKTPVKVLTPSVKPGDIVYLEMDFVKNTSVKPKISVALVNGVVFNLSEFEPINPVGETHHKVTGIRVPENMPCGDHYFKFEARYEMNFLRTIVVPYESDKFHINSTICAE